MYDGKIIDSHFHVFGGSRSEKFILDLIEKSGISAIGIVSIPNMLAHGEYFCNKELDFLQQGAALQGNGKCP